MRIGFAHGLDGGFEAPMGQYLKKYFPDDQVDCLELPIEPSKAAEYLQKYNEIYRPSIIVGHSLGGFYTMMVSGPIKILVNPVMQPAERIKDVMGFGTRQYSAKRKDGTTEFTIDENFINELKVLEDDFYDNKLDEQFKHDTYGAFGLEDKAFSHLSLYERLYVNAPASFNAPHKLNEEQFADYIAPMIREIKMFVIKDLQLI